MTMTNEKIFNDVELTGDEFRREFSTKNSFNMGVKEILEETSTVEVNTSGLTAVCVRGGGLLLDDLRDDAKVPDTVSDEAVIDTASENGSNFSIVDDGVGNLLSPNAFRSFVARMGVACAAFNKLPLNEQSRWLNSAIKYMPSKKLYFVVRGDKVRGVLTERYNTISQTEIFNATVKALERDFEDVTFSKGIITHEFTEAEYIINDEDVLDGYKSWLASKGFTYLDDAKLCVNVVTSDTTDSAVNLRAMLVSNNFRMDLGNQVSMPHFKSSSVDEWKKKIVGIGGHLEDITDSLKKLGEIKIKYPDAAFSSLAMEVGLGKKILAQYMEEFHIIYSYTESPSAHDIFYALFRALCENEHNFSKERYVTISENISRLLHPGFDWASYDIPVTL